MAYSKQLIEQFKSAYKAKHDVMLSDEGAIEELRELAELIRLMAPKEERQNESILD